MWNWLQPYRTDKITVEDSNPKDASTDVTMPPQIVTRYNALEVGKEDGKMRNDPGPYTFVEGFLQLARPIVAPKADTSTL